MKLKPARRKPTTVSAGPVVLLIVLSAACAETVQTRAGTGGGPNAEEQPGHQATEQVSAGELSTSPKYQLVFTLGQSSPHQNTSTSDHYRLHGGVVGANGSEQ